MALLSIFKSSTTRYKHGMAVVKWCENEQLDYDFNFGFLNN